MWLAKCYYGPNKVKRKKFIFKKFMLIWVHKQIKNNKRVKIDVYKNGRRYSKYSTR